MPDDSASARWGRAFLRTYAESYLRYKTLSQILEETPHEPGPHNFKGLTTIASDILEKVKKELIETTLSSYLPDREVIKSQPTTTRATDTLSALVFNTLGTGVYNQLARIHETIFLLPHHCVLPEAKEILSGTFHSHNQKSPPPIVLTGYDVAAEVDPSEFLRKLFPHPHKTPLNVSILTLPVWANRSTFSLTHLIHEMGHTKDKNHSVSKDAREHFIEGKRCPFVSDFGPEHAAAWLSEITADLIAARVVGPAAILPIVSASYVKHPQMEKVARYPKSHPPIRWRLRIVADYLEQHHGTSQLLKNEMDLADAAWDLNVILNTPEGETPLEVHARWNNLYDQNIKPFADYLISKVDGIQDLPRWQAETDVIKRCVRWLQEGRPIGSQGKGRKILEKKIRKYRDNTPQSKHRVSNFQELLAEFQEEPLDIATILVSGCEARVRLVSKFVSEFESDPDPNMLERLWGKVDTLDKIMSHSIQSSNLHRHMAATLKDKEDASHG
jgi:hypothetical protein